MPLTPGPRHRYDAWEKPQMNSWLEINVSNNTIRNDYSHSCIIKRVSREMDDIVVERFAQRRAAGEIINNPCTMRHTEETMQPDSAHIEYHPDPTTHFRYTSQLGTNSMFPLLELPEVDYERYIDSVVTAAYAKVTSESVQSLVTLGEIRETKEMFLSVIKRGYALQRHLRHWSWLKRKKLSPKLIRDAWMEVRFAWRPFVGEVQSYLALVDKVQEFAERQTFRAGFNIEQKYVQDVIEVVDGPNHLVRARYSRINVGVFAGVLCCQRYAGFPDTYGLWKLPQTVWELTRLSWLLDYVFDVGKTIASWTPDTLWDPLCAWVTVRTDSVQSCATSSAYWTIPAYTGTVFGGYVKRVERTYRRYPNPRRKTVPQFLPKMNWAKYIDAVFVASQFWEATKGILNKNLRKH